MSYHELSVSQAENSFMIKDVYLILKSRSGCGETGRSDLKLSGVFIL